MGVPALEDGEDAVRTLSTAPTRLANVSSLPRSIRAGHFTGAVSASSTGRSLDGKIKEASPRSGAPCLEPLRDGTITPFGPGIVRILALAETYASGIHELHPPCSCSGQFANKFAEPDMYSIVFVASVILAATAPIWGRASSGLPEREF